MSFPTFLSLSSLFPRRSSSPSTLEQQTEALKTRGYDGSILSEQALYAELITYDVLIILTCFHLFCQKDRGGVPQEIGGLSPWWEHDGHPSAQALFHLWQCHGRPLQEGQHNEKLQRFLESVKGLPLVFPPRVILNVLEHCTFDLITFSPLAEAEVSKIKETSEQRNKPWLREFQAHPFAKEARKTVEFAWTKSLLNKGDTPLLLSGIHHTYLNTQIQCELLAVTCRHPQLSFAMVDPGFNSLTPRGFADFFQAIQSERPELTLELFINSHQGMARIFFAPEHDLLVSYASFLRRKIVLSNVKNSDKFRLETFRNTLLSDAPKLSSLIFSDTSQEKYHTLLHLFSNIRRAWSTDYAEIFPKAETLAKLVAPKTPPKKKSEKNSPAKPFRLDCEKREAMAWKETQLIHMAAHLASTAKGRVRSRGLSIEVPAIHFVQNTEVLVRYEGESHELYLASSLLQEGWHTLLLIVIWGTSHALAKHYERSASSLDKAYLLAWQRLTLPHPFRRREAQWTTLPKDWRDMSSFEESDEQRFFEKINRLFSLSQSSNEAEAALAMEKAQNLMNAHNISRHQLGKTSESDFGFFVIHFDSVRMDRVVMSIVDILRKHYFVQAIYSTEFCPYKLTDNRVIEIYGRRHNLKIAEHILEFLYYECNKLWNDRKKEHCLDRGSKLSFQLGILAGFDEKLEQNRIARRAASQQGTGDAQALMILEKLEDDEVRDYVNKTYPKLGKLSHSSYSLDRDSYVLGKEDGKTIVVNTPIEDKAQKSKDDKYYLT